MRLQSSRLNRFRNHRRNKWTSITNRWSRNFSFVNQLHGGGGATTLGGLTDVSSTTPTGQVLKWSGTEWAPSTDLTSSGGSGIALTDLSVSVANILVLVT